MRVPLFILALLIASVELLAQERSVVSRRGSFNADIRVTGVARHWPEAQRWEAAIRDGSGRNLYTLLRDVPFDIPFPALALSDSEGRSILYSGCEGWVRFVDGQGRIVEEWSPFGSAVPDYERILRVDIGGEAVAILASGSSGDHATVYSATLDGRMRGSVGLQNSLAGELWISDGGAYIVAGSTTYEDALEQSSVVLDSTLRPLMSVGLQFRRAHVDEERGLVVIAGRDSLVLLDIVRKEVAWTWGTGARDRVISDVRVSAERVVATSDRVSLDSGAPRYSDTHVVVALPTGRIVHQESLEGESRMPSRLSVSSSSAAVMLGNSTLLVPLLRH